MHATGGVDVIVKLIFFVIRLDQAIETFWEIEALNCLKKTSSVLNSIETRASRKRRTCCTYKGRAQLRERENN